MVPGRATGHAARAGRPAGARAASMTARPGGIDASVPAGAVSQSGAATPDRNHRRNTDESSGECAKQIHVHRIHIVNERQLILGTGTRSSLVFMLVLQDGAAPAAAGMFPGDRGPQDCREARAGDYQVVGAIPANASGVGAAGRSSIRSRTGSRANHRGKRHDRGRSCSPRTNSRCRSFLRFARNLLRR
jgi:hypothetical protein